MKSNTKACCYKQRSHIQMNEAESFLEVLQVMLVTKAGIIQATV